MIRSVVKLLFVAGLMGWATATLAAPAGVTNSWKAQVSRAILEGRCDDAKTIALKANDIDTAAKAVMLCKPGSKAAVPANKSSTPPRLSSGQATAKKTLPIWVKYYKDEFQTYYFKSSSIKHTHLIIW